MPVKTNIYTNKEVNLEMVIAQFKGIMFSAKYHKNGKDYDVTFKDHNGKTHTWKIGINNDAFLKQLDNEIKYKEKETK